MEIQGAWIKPDGELIYTGMEYGHYKYALTISKTERELELLGWAKIAVYHEAVVSCRGFTQKQVDTLFDFMTTNKYDTSELGTLLDEERYILRFIREN